MANYDIERANRCCSLLKINWVQEVLDDYLDGWSFDVVYRDDSEWTCLYVREKERLILTFKSGVIRASKDTRYVAENMFMTGHSISQNIVEKRENGVVLTELHKEFAPSKKHAGDEVLIDLWERRRIYTKETLAKLIDCHNYESQTAKAILNSLTDLLYKGMLDSSDFKTEFITQELCHDKMFIIGKNSNKTKLNGVIISDLYDVSYGPNELSRIYDLYRGVLNKENEDDLIDIANGLISPQAFDLKSLNGITEKEDTLIGSAFISPSYRDYLQNFLKENFGYLGDIDFTRENILKAINCSYPVLGLDERPVARKNQHIFKLLFRKSKKNSSIR